MFQERLAAAGYGAVTTEILDAPAFYYAEAYHQQYLSKNPDGYCGIGGTGVRCPTGLFAGEGTARPGPEADRTKKAPKAPASPSE